MTQPADPLEGHLVAMLQGDEEGFAAVYTDVQPRLLRYLSVLVGPVEAEDVAAETWTQAVRDLARFSGEMDGFRGWITTIGRHRALDHLRAAGRRPLPADPHEVLWDTEVGADALTGAQEAWGTQRAVALIRTLPTEQAEAVMLRAVLGLDAKSAGAVLGRRPGAVRTAAHRGLKALARRLEEQSGNTFRAADAEETT